MSLSTLRIAWRNLGRNRRRTAFAVGAIALGQFTLVTVNGLMAGTFDEMMRAMTGPLAGHVQIQHREWREERAVDLYLQDVGELSARAAALPGVRAVSPRIYAPVLSAYGEKTDRPPDAEPAVVVGVDVAVEAEPGGLLDGRPEGGLPGGRAVLVGNVLANRLGVGAGTSWP